MFLKSLGVIGLGTLFYDPLFLVYKKFNYTTPDLQKNYGAGSYALVTGATDGIGKEFCEQLASQGMNIVLVSRSEEKLTQVSKELSEKYNIKTVTHAIDLSSATESDYQSLKQKTKGLDISTLINNAGVVSYKTTKELDYKEIQSIVTLNSISVAHLLNIYLPQLEKRKPRSAIINLSSFTSVRPVPYLSIYSASKAFDYYVSEGLSEEYKDTIDVLSFLPATVITKATPNQKPSFYACSPQVSVHSALKDLGRRRITHGYYVHELMAWVLKWTPESLRLRITGAVMPKVIKSRTAPPVPTKP
jgi:17beta-estradiol 17-dehydrogenase / very-long-chain 3-oxoacyl-CoA reductase